MIYGGLALIMGPLFRNNGGQIAQFELVPAETLKSLYSGMNWKGNVVMINKLSTFVALEVIEMTTSGAFSDDSFVKMTFVIQFSNS